MRKVIFTICAKNYIAYARTLLKSVRAHHGDVDIFLVLSDKPGDEFDIANEDWPVIPCDQLEIDQLEDMAFRYNITEFSTAIKPQAFNFFLKKHGYDIAIYLDPDTYVVNRLDEIFEYLEDSSDAVVTPHITFPVEDGNKPDDQSMLQAGIYNLGFLAVKNTNQVTSFMDWWHRRLVSDCRIELSEGLFVDQKWADLLPCFIHQTKICHHPGYNVAYWNLMQRKVEKIENDWLVNGLPARFFHFSGVESEDINVFSKHQTRFTAKNIGPLKALLDEYRANVELNGRQDTKYWPYSFGLDVLGNQIPAILRLFYRQYINNRQDRLPSDPYNYIKAVANQSSPNVKKDKGFVITRLMKLIWDSREDLQEAFNLLEESGRRGYLHWYQQSRSNDYNLSSEFCCVGIYESAPNPAGKGRQVKKRNRVNLARTIINHKTIFRPIYTKMPSEQVLLIKNRLLRAAYLDEVEKVTLCAECRGEGKQIQKRPELKNGVALIGYPLAELGMGEHVRQSSLACDYANIPHSIYNFDINILSRQEDMRVSDKISNDLIYKGNIFHINADQMLLARDNIGKEEISEKYNIGYWAWELSEFPDEWLPAVDLVDEIWAPSRFIKSALEKKVNVPVVHMPLAVHIKESDQQYDRSHFGIDEGVYIFLFYFDFASFATRKNPYGALRAFKDAFPLGTEQVSIVVKVMSQSCHDDQVAKLMESVSNDPRIKVINRVMSHDEMIDLVKVSDCFVSMHRSEGFGRGIAEAMYFGKPVIATGYSGNMDFMNENNSFPLDYHLIDVKDSEYPFGAGNVWADPDHDQAVDIMKQLYAKPELGEQIGEIASQDIRRSNSLEAVGENYRQRLMKIGLL